MISEIREIANNMDNVKATRPSLLRQEIFLPTIQEETADVQQKGEEGAPLIDKHVNEIRDSYDFRCGKNFNSYPFM